MGWQNFFENIPGLRLNRRKKDLLTYLLVIALCGMMIGADDFEEIKAYEKRKQLF
jgi:hypothetical protein